MECVDLFSRCRCPLISDVTVESSLCSTRISSFVIAIASEFPRVNYRFDYLLKSVQVCPSVSC